MARPSLPNVNFTKIPREHEGFWVVVKLGEEETVLAHAETPQEALRISRIDPTDLRFVLTQVPQTPGAARVVQSGDV